jgi:hypothetical protein
MLNPSDEDHRHPLRRALFGGEPHLSFCTDPKIPNISDFVDKVRKEIGETANTVVRTTIIECDETLSSGAKSLRKTLKLKESQPGEPVILWSVNGEKPQQLAMSVYTSEIKDAKEPKKDKKDKKDKKKKKGKGKEKKDKGKGVKVELDAKKLSEYVLKNRTPKLGSITASPVFKKKCLGRKYQLCGVVAHKGDLTQTERKFWLKTASQHRSVRFFTVDTLQHKISGVHEPSTNSSSQLTLFRRDSYVYSGPIKTLDGDVAEKLESAKRNLEATNRELKLPTEVESMGPRVRVSLALRNVLKKAYALAPRSERLVEFRKGEIETGVDFNLEEQKDDLVILLREGNVGFFLDWERAATHLIGKAAFGEVFDDDVIGELQYQTLSRASSKPTSTKYLHYDGDTGSSTAVAAFLKASVLEEMPMHAAQKDPNLIKKSKSTPARKATTPSKRAGESKKSKQSSTGNKTDRSGKGKRAKRKETEQERIERERKRRLEMEKEAEDLIALEVCEDGEPCEDEADDYDGSDDADFEGEETMAFGDRDGTLEDDEEDGEVMDLDDGEDDEGDDDDEVLDLDDF